MKKLSAYILSIVSISIGIGIGNAEGETLATGNDTTGNDLYDWCQSEDDFALVVCYIYIEGAQKGQQSGAGFALMSLFPFLYNRLTDEEYNKVRDSNTGDLLGYCIPAGVNRIQIKDLLVRHLTENAEKRHQRGDVLLWETLRGAFPCKNSTLE